MYIEEWDTACYSVDTPPFRWVGSLGSLKLPPVEEWFEMEIAPLCQCTR